MKHLDVGLDMDGIIVALHQHWLAEIEKDYGIKVALEQITQWSIHKCGDLTWLGANVVYDYLHRPGFFRTAPDLPGALESVQYLFDAVNAQGEKKYNLFIVSSPASAVSAKEKYEWLEQYMPYLKPENICLFPQKKLVVMDVLVDDRAETVLEYRKAWPSALVTGIEYPYSRGAGLVGSHTDTVAAWKTIVAQIDAKYDEVNR